MTIHEARDLIPQDIDGTSDPYAILSVERHRDETRVIADSINPVWNEKFQYEIADPNAVLRIVVMDKDRFTEDEFEGECRVDMKGLKD